MKTHNFFNRHTLISMLLCVGIISSTPIPAAPLALSDIPLFLSTSAKPNVFFLYDDSSSMQSQAVTPYIGTNINIGSVIPDDLTNLNGRRT